MTTAARRRTDGLLGGTGVIDDNTCNDYDDRITDGIMAYCTRRRWRMAVHRFLIHGHMIDTKSNKLQSCTKWNGGHRNAFFLCILAIMMIIMGFVYLPSSQPSLSSPGGIDGEPSSNLHVRARLSSVGLPRRQSSSIPSSPSPPSIAPISTDDTPQSASIPNIVTDANVGSSPEMPSLPQPSVSALNEIGHEASIPEPSVASVSVSTHDILMAENYAVQQWPRTLEVTIGTSMMLSKSVDILFDTPYIIGVIPCITSITPVSDIGSDRWELTASDITTIGFKLTAKRTNRPSGWQHELKVAYTIDAPTAFTLLAGTSYTPVKEYSIRFVWPTPTGVSSSSVAPKVKDVRITNECCGDTFNLTVNDLTAHGFVLRLERTDRHDGWGQDLIVAWITAPIIGYQLQRIHEVGSMWIGSDQLADDPAQQLHDELHSLQNPPDCTTARALLVWPLNAGAGAHFSFFAAKLAMAMVTNRTLIVDHYKWFYNDCDDARHALGCYLAPLSSCNHQHIPAGEKGVLWKQLHMDDRVVNQQIGPTVSSVFNNLMGQFAKDGINLIPPKYRVLGKTWYFAQLTAYIFRPEPSLSRSLITALESIQVPRYLATDRRAPLVGVHIRHGDKGSEGGAMVGLDRYIDAAAALMNVDLRAPTWRHHDIQRWHYRHHLNTDTITKGNSNTGNTMNDGVGGLRAALRDSRRTSRTVDESFINITTAIEPNPLIKATPNDPVDDEVRLVLFLSTDDVAIAAQAANMTRGPVRILQYPQDRSLMPQRTTTDSLARRLGTQTTGTRSRILLDVLEDWFTLSMCDSFVGTFSSNFGCVAYLMASHHYMRNVSGTATHAPSVLPWASMDWKKCGVLGIPT